MNIGTCNIGKHAFVGEKFFCTATRNWLENTTEVRVEFLGNVGEDEFDRATRSIGQLLGIKADGGNAAHAPAPERVIISGPATVLFFDDGTKVVTKCSDDDEFDPMFGIMACALRKSGRNRERIDMWEPIISYLAGYIWGADDCRVLADMLNMTADALEADGVMDAVCDYDEAHIGEEYKDSAVIHVGRIEDEPNYERTRQTIRDLVDRGEL